MMIKRYQRASENLEGNEVGFIGIRAIYAESPHASTCLQDRIVNSLTLSPLLSRGSGRKAILKKYTTVAAIQNQCML